MKLLRTSDSPDRRSEILVEGGHVLGGAIGECAIGLRSNNLCGVEFWSLGAQGPRESARPSPAGRHVGSRTLVRGSQGVWPRPRPRRDGRLAASQMCAVHALWKNVGAELRHVRPR